LIDHHHGDNILNGHKEAEEWDADKATTKAEQALCEKGKGNNDDNRESKQGEVSLGLLN